MKRFVLLTTGLLCSSSLMAGDLLSVYQQARENDPSLRASEAARFAQGEAKSQSLSLLLPSLSASGSTTDNAQETTSSSFFPNTKENFNTNSYSLTLTQPVYHHEHWVGLRQADATDKQAAANYAAAEQDLIVRVAGRYFDVLAAQDSLEFADSEKQATARQLEQAKQRFEVGLIAITDVHEAQARYDLTVAQAIQADNDLANAREALQEITGTYEEGLDALRANIPLINPEPDNQDDWVNKASKQNLTIQAAIFGLDIAREEVNRQRAGHYPSLDIVASKTESTSHASTGSERETDAISLQLNVPLFQGGFVNSKTREAAYRHTEAKELLEQQRRAVIRQTRNAYLGVQAGISRVKALNQAVVSSDKALEATKAGFEVGTRTIVDVLLSQSQLFRAKRDYSRARYDYILNTLSLKQAAGTLAEQDVKLVNSWTE